MEILKFVWDRTIAFLNTMPKAVRKNKGQFFTSIETAKYMASLFDAELLKDEISILDPGCGTGMLSAAFLERIQEIKRIKKVHLTCYETDTEVLPVLQENLEFIKNNVTFELFFVIKNEDYLLSQSDDFNYYLGANTQSAEAKYDVIIGNPPYLKISKDNPAAQQMRSVVHGAPNLYFLFCAMSLFNLKNEHEMVYIIPRSWTSGAYFKAFRDYLLLHGKITQVHLFVSRDKVFSEEQVLQETIILKILKTKKYIKYVRLTSSQSNNDFDEISSLEVPYDSVVNGKDNYVFLPTNVDEISVIKNINRYSQTLPDIGLKMKTGIVVDFRQHEFLREKEELDTVPLFYSQHIKNGRVNHLPSGKECDWLSVKNRGLIQENKNYVFCKRFTAKEESRRLQCGIFLSADFSEHENIGTQNKINFIEDITKKHLTESEVYGIYALLNSTLFDKYYRILNGSTQVNSTEINNIPVPPRNMIVHIGNLLKNNGNLSTEECDKIIKEVAYE